MFWLSLIKSKNYVKCSNTLNLKYSPRCVTKITKSEKSLINQKHSFDGTIKISKVYCLLCGTNGCLTVKSFLKEVSNKNYFLLS